MGTAIGWADGVDPELLGLVEEACADVESVFTWMDGEAVPGGPLSRLRRARARLAATRAYLWALDADADAAPAPCGGDPS